VFTWTALGTIGGVSHNLVEGNRKVAFTSLGGVALARYARFAGGAAARA
jgi:hypothetical protein